MFAVLCGTEFGTGKQTIVVGGITVGITLIEDDDDDDFIKLSSLLLL